MGSDPDFANRQGRHSLHDRTQELDLGVELTPLGCSQPAKWLDSYDDLSTGAVLVPDPAHHAIDQQHRIVAGLARRGQGAVAAGPG